ncbi:MAG: NTP transferase domain-containing protein [Chloroflexi bacterium]|nr:NTP transferase domain-containing protein [Chloroflexota bacterium]
MPDGRVGAVILAAGSSSRMGRPKLLLPFDGRTLVRRAADAALGSGARPVVLVTGAYRAEVEEEIRGLPVHVAFNPRHAEGMSTSLRAGLTALGPEVDAAIVLLADQPLVDGALVDALVERYRATGAPIVRPRFNGQPGNPVLWDRCLFPELLEQSGDQGGRSVLRGHASEIAWVELDDDRCTIDVDTPEAYDTLRARPDAGDNAIHTGVHDTPRVEHGHSDPAERFCSRCGGVLAERPVEGERRRPACSACGTIVWADPKVAVATLISWDGGLLLGRRAIDPGRGRWSFPSGYVDRGEVLEEAARREVFEETGLDVEVSTLVGAYSTRGKPVILLAYAATVRHGTPTPGPEVLELAAFPPDRLPEMAFDHDDRIVADWLRLRPEVEAS